MIDEIRDNASPEINSPEFNESGKNKVKAISSAQQAEQIARKLEDNDANRDIRRARVLSAFNGAAPYSASSLISKGQGYRYNVSFGFMEGVIGRAVVPYNELTVNIGELTDIEANLPEHKLKIIQQEFGTIVQKWGKWPKFITRLNQDLVLNGYNTAIFPSDYDPFPVFVPQKEGFVDEGAPNDVTDLEVFVWKRSYLIHELYSKIEDTEVARKAGWEVENVREALMKAAPQSLFSNNMSISGMWTKMEEAIRGGSLFTSMVGAKTVNVYHVFAAELNGKVTHWIVLNDGQAVDPAANGTYFTEKTDGKTELFYKEDRFENMRDFLVYFDLETGDGTWHGSRGIGQRSFNTHKAIDKLRNSVLDQAFVSGLTIMQPSDQTSQEELTLTVVGPFAVVPPNIGIQPATLPAVSATTFQVDALLAATSEQRVGDVVPQVQSQFADQPETATAARLKAGRQELITRGNLKRYIDPISQVTSIMVRRLLKKNSPNAFAKEFQKELLRKGLTEEDLKEIRGARNTGRIEDILGNTVQGTQIIFAEFRGDPEVDQIKLKQRRIASVLDAEAANDLIITDEDQTKVIEARRQQELELTSILSGLKIPVSPRDNHEVHLATCLEWLGVTVQQQAQGLNPEAIPAMKVVLQHAQGHLAFIKGDKSKKSAYEDLKDRVKLTEDTIEDLEKQALDLARANIDAAAKIAQTPEEKAQVEQARAGLE